MVGIPEIDNEHKTLIDQIDVLYHAMKEGHGETEIEKTLDFIEGYVHTHFRHEEALYKKYNYPGLADHHRIHEGFRVEIKAYRREILSKPITPSVAIEVNKILMDWLRHHIGNEDKKASKFLLEQMKQ